MSTVAEFWRTLDARDWTAFGATLSDDVEARWPQSRERVRGREALVRFMAAYPGDWRLALEQEYGVGDSVATRVAFTVDGKPFPA